MFKDEIDLLQIRLLELQNHVDFFVIVESNLTNTNRPKPWIFEQNIDKFRPYLSKIRYIKYISPGIDNPWHNENSQRCAINQGIADAGSDDLIIVADVDEIPRAESIDLIRDHGADLFGFHMPLFNFKFNFMRTNPGRYDIWATAAPAHWVKSNSPQAVRNLKESSAINKIHHGGWHFGYFGDTNYLREKAKDTCHQEDINPEFLSQLDVGKSIKEKKYWDRRWPYEYEIVDLDDYFPASCQLFPQHRLDDTGIKISDFLSVPQKCWIENS